MTEKEEFIETFKKRTKAFAVLIIKFNDQMKNTESTRVIGRQLIRSATSTAANYRAACVARSKAEFFSKMSIVVEEADETLFWLELIEDSQLSTPERIQPLTQEITEILKVVSKARKNTNR